MDTLENRTPIAYPATMTPNLSGCRKARKSAQRQARLAKCIPKAATKVWKSLLGCVFMDIAADLKSSVFLLPQPSANGGRRLSQSAGWFMIRCSNVRKRCSNVGRQRPNMSALAWPLVNRNSILHHLCEADFHQVTNLIWPLPVAYFGQIVTSISNILAMLNEFVTDHLLHITRS